MTRASDQKQMKHDTPSCTWLEPLEPRLLLTTVIDLSAATPAPNNVTFTDQQGDVVTIQLSGTAGTATITSDDLAIINAGNLDAGENIAGIAITGATNDFVMKFSVDSGGAGANGNVLMGNITSDRVIGGILTVDDTTGGAVPAMVSTAVFTWLACWKRSAGSFSSARNTTSSSRTSISTLREGASNFAAGSSPVSI